MGRLIGGWHEPFTAFDGSEGSGGSNADVERERNKAAEAKRKQEAADARAREAEKERDEVRARLEALEGEGQSEVAKLQAKLAKVEQERDGLKSTLSANEKQTHIRAVAGGYNPHDVEALFKFVDLEGINSEDDAKRALDGIKDTHSFLFKTDETPTPVPGAPVPGRPQGFGAPVNGGGIPGQGQPAVPLKPDGTPDVQTGIGMGVLGALDRFRAGRG